MRSERQLVRVSRDLSIDLGGDVERPVDQTPARHPLLRPARLVFWNRGRLPDLDAAEVEVVGCQRLNLGITGGPTFLEVRYVPPLVGLDVTDSPDDAPEKCGIELGIEIRACDPRPVEERRRDQATSSLLPTVIHGSCNTVSPRIMAAYRSPGWVTAAHVVTASRGTAPSSIWSPA